eukprot:TRINITY_DN81424_c0_g1_i1.p1 TRINITY_DN81424_c0_g1~~TRINITY_DN81424_c0_g1_i1.p1  ORF type:complete len:411 (-),score=88.44 TRINITY_DN81424_c0_g1_i1:28-1134(-)
MELQVVQGDAAMLSTEAVDERLAEELQALHSAFVEKAASAAKLSEESIFGSAAGDFVNKLDTLLASGKAEADTQIASKPHQLKGQRVRCSHRSSKAAKKRPRSSERPFLKRELQERRFLSRLRTLLQQLPPDSRRQSMEERLTESQRVRLEQWILSERSAKEKMGFVKAKATAEHSGLSLRSLCVWRGRVDRIGYRPNLRLWGCFVVQASFTFDIRSAVAAFADLLVMRAFCKSARPISPTEEVRSEDLPHLKGALESALCCIARCHASHEEGIKFYFKTRRRTGSNSELSSPSTQDIQQALEHWTLLRARNLGAFEAKTGRKLSEKAQLMESLCDRNVKQTLRRLESLLQEDELWTAGSGKKRKPES